MKLNEHLSVSIFMTIPPILQIRLNPVLFSSSAPPIERTNGEHHFSKFTEILLTALSDPFDKKPVMSQPASSTIAIPAESANLIFIATGSEKHSS